VRFKTRYYLIIISVYLIVLVARILTIGR